MPPRIGNDGKTTTRVAPLVVLVVLAVAPAFAVAQFADTASNIAGFDHITTDKIKYNQITGNFELPHRFKASRANDDVSADHATGNAITKTLHAEGNVVVHQERTAQGASTKPGDVQGRESTLTTDRLDVDGTRKTYVATGNMHFTQEGGRDATSDRASLDEAEHHLHLEGHAVVKNGEQTISADTIDYNTITGEVEGSGNVTIVAPLPTPGPGKPPKKRKKLPF